MAWLLRVIVRIEDAMLVLLLAAMILLAGSQILLRNLFDTGFVSGDPFLRVLVLWVGLMGAVVASREDRHISIDLFSRLLSVRARVVVRAIIDLFVSVVCALVAYHAARFVLLEYEAGTEVFPGFSSWVAQVIMPVAFGIIALRYFLFLVRRLRQLAGRGVA